MAATLRVQQVPHADVLDPEAPARLCHAQATVPLGVATLRDGRQEPRALIAVLRQGRETGGHPDQFVPRVLEAVLGAAVGVDEAGVGAAVVGEEAEGGLFVNLRFGVLSRL